MTRIEIELALSIAQIEYIRTGDVEALKRVISLREQLALYTLDKQKIDLLLKQLQSQLSQ